MMRNGVVGLAFLVGSAVSPAMAQNNPEEYANRAIIDIWNEVERHLRCALYLDNDCEPRLGSWHYDCPGGGSVDWEVTDDSGNLFTGISTFNYRSCALTSGLVIDGEIRGEFNVLKNGETEGTVHISGSGWDATIVDNIVIQNTNKSDGTYTVTCSADPLPNLDCASGPVTYHAPFE